MFRWLFDRSWSARNAETSPGGPQPESAAKFTVRQGKRYRATVELGWMEQIASNDMIADKLREVGFKDVKVTGSGSTRVAEAVWPGPDRTAQLDSHLTKVSEIV